MQPRTFALLCTLALQLALSSRVAQAQYRLANLVSNQVKQAKQDDPLIVNAWGLVRSSTSPWWVSDNLSGWSTLYNGDGIKQALIVAIPSVTMGAPGSPTGVVYNGSSAFQVQGATKAEPSFFLFDTLDGTISGWSPKANPSSAIIATSKPGASYTGLAIASTSSFLFAADNANNVVDIYDGNFKLKSWFTDSTIPTGANGFSVFGIRDINGSVYVTFAANSGGPGGYVDIFDEDGTFMKRFAEGAPLNQPWGVAVAPANFGPLRNTLLISNNTNTGTINGFSMVDGHFVGTIRDVNGRPIRIDQLWAIDFGGGTANNGATNELFFTAGPFNNLAGTFGSIVVK
jgi:uncharacterized protein (TIGR03118 family)